MSSNSSLRSHPLESLTEDDDDRVIRVEIGSSVNYVRSSSYIGLDTYNSSRTAAAAADTATSLDSLSNPPTAAAVRVSSCSESTSDSSTFVSNVAIAAATSAVSKPKPPKRIAPKLPDEALSVRLSDRTPPNVKPTFSLNDLSPKAESLGGGEERFTSFYIDIEQVRWFYKNDKEPSTSQTGLFPSSASTQGLFGMSSNSSSYNLAAEAAQLPQPQSSSNLNSPSDGRGPSPPPPSDINNNANSGSSNSSTIHTSKKWHMFSKWDSISLEVEYRDMVSKTQLNQQQPAEAKLVQVLDNLFEVNLSTKKCYPIYWKQTKTMSVRRCIWFKDTNEPLDEKVGEEIERKHIELFRDTLVESPGFVGVGAQTSSLNSSSCESSSQKLNGDTGGSDEPTGKSAVGTLSFDDGSITWYSRDEIYWGKKTLNFIDYLVGFSKMGNKIAGVTGTKIRRGFREKGKDPDVEEKKPKEITHVVFVIHGIAQKLYENSIIKNADDLRKEFEKKKKEHFPNHDHLHYIFIPVDWRSSLILDDGIIESITPKSIQTIRDKLNSSALDIMYYTSPLFRSEIINSLTTELNRLYKLFCLKNPNFVNNEKVSFVAHSLGTVITYDILTACNSISMLSNMYGEDETREKLIFNHFSHNDSKLLDEYLTCKNRMQEIELSLVKSNKSITTLEFRSENLFILGSPLAVFLALRGVRPAGKGTQDHILPKHICKRLFNIFHPSDAIAYRLEPLILKHYATKSPVEIQKNGEVCYKELNKKRSALNVDLKSALTKGLAKKKEKGDAKSAELDQIKEDAVVVGSKQSSQGKNTPQEIDQVELEAALDYQLQDSNFELVAAIRAHFGYWKSLDVASFICHQLVMNDSESAKGANNS